MKQFPILLVDDDPAMVELLTRAAQRHFPEAVFWPVFSFVQAAAYLEGLQGPGPRLVLLDIHFHTGLSGFDFLELIRQHPQGRLVPVIMLSTGSDYREVQEAYSRGANAYTQKPYSIQGWENYVQELRLYWYKTVSIPMLWFNSESTD